MPRRLTKEESRKRYAEGRRLWIEFDPIGAFKIDAEWPKSEYDSYVGPILRLYEDGKSVADVRKYLSMLSTIGWD